MRYTISINNDKRAIEKLSTLGRKKGKYIEGLILDDIRFDELEMRISKLEGRESKWEK